MTSIRKLEKLLEPYNIGGGASSSFTDYDEYQHLDITARVDEEDWLFTNNPRINYRKALEKAAKKLGLLN